MWSLWKQWCKASDISGNDEAVYHTKGDAKPVVTIMKGRDTLQVEGRDYTVTYKNNKAPGTSRRSSKEKEITAVSL